LTSVTALEDKVPPSRLGDLVERLLGQFIEPRGRLMIGAYTTPTLFHETCSGSDGLWS